MHNRFAHIFFGLLVIPLSILWNSGNDSKSEVFDDVNNKWVDSVFNSMTPEERLGQLFMMPAYSNKGKAEQDAISEMIRKYHIGGVIMMQGGPVRQINMVNHFQSISKVPLLVSQDAEWGLDMRLDSTPAFPRQLTLGAIQDPELIYDMGKAVAEQCKRVGVNMNFAPVIDVNNNARNPVINDRSFGENRYNVALRGIQYMKGLQDGQVIACAKHFPGHGDTDKDSHLDLPVIMHSRARLDSIELFPFRILINQGVLSIMTAHLYIPALDKTVNAAASISHNIVTDLLIRELGFQGLIVTDALNMKGVSAFNEPGQAELKALLAGNDILLFPGNIPKAINLIQDAVKKGNISQEEIDRRVKKVLKSKYWAGLHEWKPLSPDFAFTDLNNNEVEAIKYKLYENAMTIAANKQGILPFQIDTNTSFASLAIGAGNLNEFQLTLNKYAPFAHFQIGKEAPSVSFDQMTQVLKRFEHVVVSFHDMSRHHSRNYGISQRSLDFLQNLSKETKVTIVVFGNPYSLKYFDEYSTVAVAYEDNKITQSLAAQLLFGGIPAKGALPVTASSNFKYGAGHFTDKAIRLGYTIPEAVGINSAELLKIDIIAIEAVETKATPGGQIILAKDGKVFYEKAFGHHTYEKTRPVQLSDIYDIASVTKIAATTLSLMKLTDDDLFDPNDRMSKYLPEWQDGNLARLQARDVLTHTAGLQPWIPFYASTVKDDTIYNKYYCYSADATYCIPVANELYMRRDFVDSINFNIISSTLQRPGIYKYSDLGFYMFRYLVEQQANMPFDKYVQQNFYKPLGLSTMTFNPADRFPLERIPPTEMDMIFRKQLVHGYVHDQGAAMLGGVSGHAGLFSNANDLAIIMQMLLNGGEYGGRRYINEKTVRTWTKKQTNKYRRGLGFDKPEEKEDRGPTAKSASPQTFGHTGFTGTAAWADPKNDLVYVFLSNRVYPDAENKKLITNDIRTRIQQVAYEAIEKGTGKRN